MALDRNSLRLALVSRQVAASAGGFVMLSQEAWDPYAGHLTKMQVLSWLAKIIFAGPDPASFCPNTVGDGYAKTIYAFPSRESLRFNIGCSNGSLVAGPVQYLDFTELLQVSLDRTPPLKYPALRITSAAWDGDVYNAKGEQIPPPQISIVNNALSLAAEVYGSLRLTYQVFRHVYTLTVQPRAEYAENKFQSFVYVVWDGGTSYLEVEAPIGAESDASAMTCANRFGSGFGSGQFDPLAGVAGSTTGGELETDDDSPFGPVSGEDENIDIDYCTQEVI